MKKKYTKLNNLSVSSDLLDFVNNNLLKDTDIAPDKFWLEFDTAVHNLAQKNKDLLEIREKLQIKLNEWHKKKKGNKIDLNEYKSFLEEIGYLKKTGPNFKIKTKNIDEEISNIAAHSWLCL